MPNYKKIIISTSILRNKWNRQIQTGKYETGKDKMSKYGHLMIF